MRFLVFENIPPELILLLQNSKPLNLTDTIKKYNLKDILIRVKGAPSLEACALKPAILNYGLARKTKGSTEKRRVITIKVLDSPPHSPVSPLREHVKFAEWLKESI